MLDLTRIRNLPFAIYGLLISMLYASVAAGQLLGLVGWYRAAPVHVVFAITAALLVWSYLRKGEREFFDALRANPGSGEKSTAWFDGLLYGCGALLLALLIIYPLIRWPGSFFNQADYWDAAAYHFPKAVELFRTASAWDLSVPYGQYPFGFEALLAQALTITGDETLFGAVHALIALYLFFTLWFIARRYTNLPDSWLFLLVSGLLVSGKIVHVGNPWWFLGLSLFSVGLNDIFLAATLLAVILHAPIGARKGASPYHRIGLAMNTMLALSTKPNSAYLVAFIWAYLLIQMWRGRRSEPRRFGSLFKSLAPSVALVLPGVLWVGRNLAVMGVVFSEGLIPLQQHSIAFNLTNPLFYEYIPRNLIGLFGIVMVAVAGSALFRFPSWGISSVLAVLFINFILTPSTAFGAEEDVATAIKWRLGMAALGYSFIVLLLLLQRIISPALAALRRGRFAMWTVASMVILMSAWGVYQSRGLLELHPRNYRLVSDPYEDPVGTGGYHSVYGYIQRNIRNAVIHIERGLPYYAYGPGYTNLPTRMQHPLGRAWMVPQPEPDYFLIFETGWWGDRRGYPDSLSDPSFKQQWELIYEDRKARLYKRITPPLELGQ
jgi:hypothetical protein